jgi:hypothetical protein
VFDMVQRRQITLLGTRRRTEVLIAIALLGETFPAELARVLGARLYSVQNIVSALDRDGVIASRVSGRARVVSLDPRYFAYPELKKLLLKLAEAEPGLRAAASGRRSRPRRAATRL